MRCALFKAGSAPERMVSGAGDTLLPKAIHATRLHTMITKTSDRALCGVINKLNYFFIFLMI